ncbi:FecR domain-containing protein [Pedobacter sp. ASV1-7]|uniref:FecR family protein n=1 Tax=Pedobacter sp. ASV1-7 TaxID=3145237 RepID=UPI0032E8F401
MITDQDYIRQLYMEKLTGTLSSEDEIHLQKILKADIANQTIWDELERQSAFLGAEKFIETIQPESDLEVLKNRVQQAQKRKNSFRIYAAAASILIVAGLSIWFGLENYNTNKETLVHNKTKADANQIQLQLENGEFVTLSKEEKNQQINYGGIKLRTSNKGLEGIEGEQNALFTTLSVPAKQDYQVTLSDGTKVRLNSVSKLRFPIRFNGKSREVYLEGEAFLEVAKDSSRPFIVHTKQSDIKVLGTKFNVNTYDGITTKTSLVEGSVLLSANHQTPMKLKPGEQGVYDSSSGFSKNDFDKEYVLSWINGIYYFQNARIEELSEVINRWFGLSVIVESPKLRELRLSGMLEKTQLPGFLKDLETSSNIQYHLTGNKLILK